MKKTTIRFGSAVLIAVVLAITAAVFSVAASEDWFDLYIYPDSRDNTFVYYSDRCRNDTSSMVMVRVTFVREYSDPQQCRCRAEFTRWPTTGVSQTFSMNGEGMGGTSYGAGTCTPAMDCYSPGTSYCSGLRFRAHGDFTKVRFIYMPTVFRTWYGRFDSLTSSVISGEEVQQVESSSLSPYPTPNPYP